MASHDSPAYPLHIPPSSYYIHPHTSKHSHGTDSLVDLDVSVFSVNGSALVKDQAAVPCQCGGALNNLSQVTTWTDSLDSEGDNLHFILHSCISSLPFNIHNNPFEQE